MICPYCKKQAIWCENKAIYGKNYGKSYMCWLCKDCNAYVGCHNNTKKPLGTMTNAELREWRVEAHKAFDKLWKGEGHYAKKRKKAYQLLKEKFGREIHIGESDIETCKEIINLIQNYERNTKTTSRTKGDLCCQNHKAF